MKNRARFRMPRPRKFDYKKDYPVRVQLHLRLPAGVLNSLEDMGYDRTKMSKEVEIFLAKLVENGKKVVD